MTTDTSHTAPDNARHSNLILMVCLSILICINGYCGYKLDILSNQQEQLKQDYSTINNITFGIFSIDQWRDKILGVVNKQVHDFKMTRQQKKAMQAQIEKQLHGLIGKTAAEINRPQKSLGGKLKKLAFNAIVDVDDIQAQVPAFAKTIITKVNSPSSTKRLKGIATSKLQQLERQTYDSTAEAQTSVAEQLYRKYNVKSTTDLNKKLTLKLTAIRAVTYNYAYVMFGCVIIAAAMWLFLRKKIHLQRTLFILSLLLAFILLAVGVTASIIEVDARIGTLSFQLMGEKLGFENQVLFFQSKSILQIIQVLVYQPKPDSVLIGVLLFIFVIVLPVLILIATGLHVIGGKRIEENKVIRYLTFESGKWNMADVMVVGVLMTYIGLNGILKSQLSSLNIHNDFLTTVTTNDSSLQPGFLIFVSYVIYEIVLSKMLKEITAKQAESPVEPQTQVK